MRAHFAAVSEAAGETPIVLYNIPSRCGINLPPELLATLAAEHENVVAVKQANNDDLGPIEGLEILAGNDEVFLRTLEFGGAGGILVASNVAPRRLRDLYDAAVGGDATAASSIDAELGPLYAAMTVAPPAVSAKTALELLGVIAARRAAADGRRLGRRARRDPARRSRAQGLDREQRGLSGPIRILPLGGLGEIGKNMTVFERDGRIVRRRHRPDVPDRRDARHRSRPAGLRLSARSRRRHRGDRAHARATRTTSARCRTCCARSGCRRRSTAGR